MTEVRNSRGDKMVVIKIGKLHAVFWTMTVISGIVFSFLTAWSLFTGFGSFQIFLFSTLATLALTATLFAMSKDNVVIRAHKDGVTTESDATGTDSETTVSQTPVPAQDGSSLGDD